MGKGRDKRKKKSKTDMEKQAEKAERQHHKLNKVEEKKARKVLKAEAGNDCDNVDELLQRARKMEEKKRVVTEKDVPPPSARSNGTLVPHPLRDGELVLFGGDHWNGAKVEVFNDLYVYNIAKNSWRLLSIPNTPIPRSSHQVAVHKASMVVFGGEFASPSQTEYYHHRDTWRLNFTTETWDEIKTKPSPSARSGHRIVMWKNKAVLFGGFYDTIFQTQYFNDLWVLSDIEGKCQWKEVVFPGNMPAPEKRSGHCMAVHDDILYLYGGYSAEKRNRFGKMEITVHHDLWTVNLGNIGLNSEVPAIWQKVKLAGIPPPIRSGVSFVVKEKKMYLFGGVVDMDQPGNRTSSSFFHDLYCLHMDSMRFFPVTLKPRKKGKPSNKPAESSSDDDDDDGVALLKHTKQRSLIDELNELQKANKDGRTASQKEEEDDDVPQLQQVHFSYIEDPPGVIVPCGRMNAMTAIVGNTMFVMGGQFEIGSKEITLRDLFSLNLKALDGFVPIVKMDMASYEWHGEDSDHEGSQESWEDGSTVVDPEELAALRSDSEDDDDDDDSDEEERRPAKATEGSSGSDDDAEESALVSKLQQMEVDRRTRKKGGGRKYQLEQLVQQLHDDSTKPTPVMGEDLTSFYQRTIAYWTRAAEESYDGSKKLTAKRIEREGLSFCRVRYLEAMPLVEQVTELKRLLAEEQEVIANKIEERRKTKASRHQHRDVRQLGEESE